MATLGVAARLGVASAQDGGLPMDGGAPEPSEAGAAAESVGEGGVPIGPPAPEPTDAGGPGPADVEAGDVGVPPIDAGVAAVAATDRDWLAVLSELVFERTEEAGRAAQRADERLDQRESRPAAGAGVVPVRVVDDAPIRVVEDVPVRFVGCEPGGPGFDLPERKVSTGALVALFAFALLCVWVLSRVRKSLPERGLVPRVFGVAYLTARLTAVVVVLMLATRLLPGWLRPAILLAIGAGALVIGAGSIWLILPDLIGGLLLITEDRLRPGMWVVGDGFEGTVERVGPRLTTFRAPDGAKLTIPNRRLVKSPILASDRRWHEVEVDLHVPGGHDATSVRRALEDAVLCSPFVPPDPALEVTRDAADPNRWRVRARILDASYSDRFEGQLLERVEEGLAIVTA